MASMGQCLGDVDSRTMYDYDHDLGYNLGTKRSESAVRLCWVSFVPFFKLFSEFLGSRGIMNKRYYLNSASIYLRRRRVWPRTWNSFSRFFSRFPVLILNGKLILKRNF